MKLKEVVSIVEDIVRDLLPSDALDGVSIHLNIRSDKTHATLRELDELGFEEIDIVEGSKVYEMTTEETVGDCSIQVVYTTVY